MFRMIVKEIINRVRSDIIARFNSYPDAILFKMMGCHWWMAIYTGTAFYSIFKPLLVVTVSAIGKCVSSPTS